MAPEEFKITIARSGEVLVDLRGVGEQRVRDLRQMLEEVIGPIVRELSVSEGGPGGTAVRILTDDEEKRFQIKNP